MKAGIRATKRRITCIQTQEEDDLAGVRAVDPPTMGRRLESICVWASINHLLSRDEAHGQRPSLAFQTEASQDGGSVQTGRELTSAHSNGQRCALSNIMGGEPSPVGRFPSADNVCLERPPLLVSGPHTNICMPFH